MTADNDDLQRDPEAWKSGDDPMTDAQKVYLDTLSQQTGEPAPPDDLNKAEASEKIEQLRDEAGLKDDDETDNDIEMGDDKRDDEHVPNSRLQ